MRDTWEIGKRQIKLDERHWQRTLDRKLPRIARDLGVPEGATLRAELHNLLVYEPGQFFAPHQDSEKADGMIGSLVVLLPSDAKGGALVIEHHDERVNYRGSSSQPVLVAFYADCRHEVRAELLREVAERLDCEIVLALADVHESWSCEDDGGYSGYGYGRRRRGWHARYDEDDGDEESDGDEDYTLIELFDSDVELRHWVSTSNKRMQAISGEVLDDEICFTKPSVDLEPFKSEHEGYTGNAGNTVDRWYHRAAVLLWPRTRAFAIRAKASPAWGIREITKALARGKLDVARQRIGDLLPFWNRVAPHENAPGLADQVFHVAYAVDDAQLATAIVEPIAIEQVTPKLAARWVDLLARYGLTWCSQVFERWTARADRYSWSTSSSWVLFVDASRRWHALGPAATPGRTVDRGAGGTRVPTCGRDVLVVAASKTSSRSV